MVCKNSNCKMEYCWVCLGPWEPHGSSWYNCNRFDDGAAKQARDAQEAFSLYHINDCVRNQFDIMAVYRNHERPCSVIFSIVIAT